MKKILSILLALIFCFGTLVSCGDEESSSSESSQQSESSTIGTDSTETQNTNAEPIGANPKNEGYVKYYYRKTYKKEEMVFQKPAIRLIESKKEMQEYFTDKGFYWNDIEDNQIEAVLSDNYILIISRNPSLLIGYRDAYVTDNGEAVIMADVLKIYDEMSYSTDGTVYYVERDSDIQEEPEQSDNYYTCYDVIYIPKSECVINPDKIRVENRIHQTIKNPDFTDVMK
ncbi:MAG: hypothetical protein IJZ04_10385 [Clostridia bacterium]|nr:hypothetical protein [Clostridia bacterium]MBQ8739884.1 hypothetical protein [Clostridia bacterium]